MTCPGAPSSHLAPKPQKSKDGQDDPEDAQADAEIMNSPREKQASLRRNRNKWPKNDMSTLANE